VSAVDEKEAQRPDADDSVLVVNSQSIQRQDLTAAGLQTRLRKLSTGDTSINCGSGDCRLALRCCCSETDLPSATKCVYVPRSAYRESLYEGNAMRHHYRPFPLLARYSILLIFGAACASLSLDRPVPAAGTAGEHSGTSTTLDASNVAQSVSRTLQVDDFGAKGDGSTDDTVAIRLAFTTACSRGGGTVRFSPHKTYLLNTPLPSGGACGTSMLEFPCSNLYVNAYGATIKQTTKAGHATICFGRHNANPEALANAKSVNAAIAGTNRVTLTTSGDSSLFTAGDPVLLQVNPFVDYNHFIVNYVASVDPSTGVITLLNTLEHTLTPHPVIADIAHNGWEHNIRWSGGEIDSSDDYVFNMWAHDSGTIRDVVIKSTQVAANDLFSGGETYGDTYSNVKISTPCSGGFDFSSRGFTHITINEHSELTETGIGGCSTNAPISLANAGEGTSYITFDNLHVSDATGQGAIVSTHSYYVKYNNITAVFAPPVATTPAHVPIVLGASTIMTNSNLKRGGTIARVNFVQLSGAAQFTNNVVDDYGNVGCSVYNRGAVESKNTISVHNPGPKARC
jgi:hypothetical protein